MEISKGFQIENPKIFVPWDIDENNLVELFKDQKIKLVAPGYYTTSCDSLNGLTCMLGFHFEPRMNGKLKELEFFRLDYNDQKKSFNEFQKCFVGEFGNPTKTSKGSEGFNNYEWILNDIVIVHFIFDRFGPEEHMRIKKT